jgi:predicted PurR-regulated permease PerM
MSESKKPVYVSITTSGIIKIFLLLALFYFLFLIRHILLVFFVSLVLASAINPWVDWLQRRKIPRALSVLFIYLSALTVISSVIYLLIPPIYEQIQELSYNLPRTLENISSSFYGLQQFMAEQGVYEQIKNYFVGLSENLEGAAGNIFSRVSGVLGGIFSLLLVLVVTFYMAVEENAMKKIVWSIAPEKHQVYIMHLVNRMQRKVGLWLRGQLILSLIIFVLTYLGLLILDVKYALVLALVAGLAEFVPYLGPIIAAIPAMFLAFTQDGLMFALFVGALYYIIQLVENHIVVPKLMQKVVGLNPIVIIAVLLIGFRIASVPGAILAIPVATAAHVFIKDVFDQRVGQVDAAEEDA